jgi:hypothetical protein
MFFVFNKLRVLSDVTGDLVGGVSPSPLKNDGLKVSWDDEIPNLMEKCSKAPTRSAQMAIELGHLCLINGVFRGSLCSDKPIFGVTQQILGKTEN